MRTTVVLDDEVVREVKRRAAEEGATLSGFINRALREALTAPLPDTPPFEMITYGSRGRRVRHEPTDFARALEEEDRGSR
jgi:hypothetical protein